MKGTSRQLIENGKILWNEMEKSSLTQEDLVQEMRTAGHTGNLDSIKEAFFERSGDISIIPFHPQPRVLEVKVEKGVQTVRIIIDS